MNHTETLWDKKPVRDTVVPIDSGSGNLAGLLAIAYSSAMPAADRRTTRPVSSSRLKKGGSVCRHMSQSMQDESTYYDLPAFWGNFSFSSGLVWPFLRLNLM